MYFIEILKSGQSRQSATGNACEDLIDKVKLTCFNFIQQYKKELLTVQPHTSKSPVMSNTCFIVLSLVHLPFLYHLLGVPPQCMFYQTPFDHKKKCINCTNPRNFEMPAFFMQSTCLIKISRTFSINSISQACSIYLFQK